MPAVHKLLLEEALQDSPQVGLYYLMLCAVIERKGIVGDAKLGNPAPLLLHCCRL